VIVFNSQFKSSPFYPLNHPSSRFTTSPTLRLEKRRSMNSDSNLILSKKLNIFSVRAGENLNSKLEQLKRKNFCSFEWDLN